MPFDIRPTEDRSILVFRDRAIKRSCGSMTPGVPEVQLDRIFEPFNRCNRSEGDGTGLGLSIVRRIVDNHQGSISLENVTSSRGRAFV